MSAIGSLLWRNLRIYQVYGANTDVGKTVLTTLLCRGTSGLYEGENISYLKPVSTGPEDEADSRHATPIPATYQSSRRCARPGWAPRPWSQSLLTIFPQWQAPTDAQLLSLIHGNCARAASTGPGWLFLETAGGVHSPSPSGTTQADLYAALRLPVVLIGDSKLGGISLTISAFESLRMRGYDVEQVLMFDDDRYGNADYLKGYFGRFGLPVASVEKPPLRGGTRQEDEDGMRLYYASEGSASTVRHVVQSLGEKHAERVRRLESMSAEAYGQIWFPFTQHSLLQPADIAVIDSARGDFFHTLSTRTRTRPLSGEALLEPSFDGSASWWTQGLGHGDPSLMLAAAYAAGRYGHVMFAEAVHEPALALAEALLAGMRRAGNQGLTRVFYSDNGSTGVEVALKMALRASARRYGWTRGNEHVGVLALKGGYHGDTLGAMECSEPGTFNRKVDWYSGRGLWLDYSTVSCVQGRWVVTLPAAMRGQTSTLEFGSLSQVFDVTRRPASETLLYENYIEDEIRKHVDGGHKLGALLVEPVVIGAGGMLLVDPLFQHALVNLVRRSTHLFGDGPQSPSSSPPPSRPLAHDWAGLPVVFDEVFTGLYRLGTFTSSSLIQAQADISVHAKLLTGGLLPLAATLASDSIFEAFAGTDKTDALLHGHSYTAHPVGCQTALESLRQLCRMDADGHWNNPTAIKSWTENENSDTAPWSIWPREFVEVLSTAPSVAGVWALGTVLAVHMKAADGAGYTSTAALALRDGLRVVGDGHGHGHEHGHGHGHAWGVHSRVLGNVLYLMGGQRTSAETVGVIVTRLRAALVT